ncbi:MAG: aminotransferase class IV [Acidobacteria bacterium]|nr:aminotransferase class IV [Acidobacteriota bacterium]
MHRCLLYNEELRDTAERLLAPGQAGLLNGWGVFSTLHVCQGVLFAYQRHWHRMLRDAQRMHIPMPPSPEVVHHHLLRLVAANHAENSTLRLAIIRNTGGPFDAPGLTRPYDLIAFTKDLSNWGPSARLALKPHGRHGACEFAGAKITAWAQNLTWYEQSRHRGYDEVLLLDEHGRVSECTSANLFAIFGQTVLTPPLDSGCLPGITREILLDSLSLPGVSIHERHLYPADLERADAIFITSSTRELLPVAEIESLRLPPPASPLLPLLLQAFRDYRDHYLQTATGAFVTPLPSPVLPPSR